MEKSALTKRVSRFKKELDTRKSVETAKDILMKRENLTENQVYRRLQKISKEKNRTIEEIAEAINLVYQ